MCFDYWEKYEKPFNWLSQKWNTTKLDSFVLFADRNDGVESKNSFLLLYISFHVSKLFMGKSKITDFESHFCSQLDNRWFDLIELLFILSLTNVASLWMWSDQSRDSQCIIKWRWGKYLEKQLNHISIFGFRENFCLHRIHWKKYTNWPSTGKVYIFWCISKLNTLESQQHGNLKNLHFHTWMHQIRPIYEENGYCQ